MWAFESDGVYRIALTYTVEALGTREAIGVLDETGDVKKGRHSVGVQRQYTGTAGRIENSQVAVFLSYGTALGHTLIDAELYLPKSWTDDRDRCAAAGVPDDVGFATKPVLAARMITRVLDAGVVLPWIAGDEVY
ncbi:transposase [Nocardia sp. NPDC052278]|uniref:IS701 family transposase n=1 Tax=unclassified Nocardia TaxID=2637762 RepID=UPI0036CB0490